ncbi:hypothetical protein N8Z18_00480 [bacterium]|nr:hypothetical protein [bacterium]
MISKEQNADHGGSVRYLVNKFIILFCVIMANAGNAEEIECANFGTVVFFKTNSSSNIQHCISTQSNDELGKIHPKGISEIRKWTWKSGAHGNLYRFNLRVEDEIEYAMYLIKQKYQYMNS